LMTNSCSLSCFCDMSIVNGMLNSDNSQQLQKISSRMKHTRT
jgi:4-hydroxy-3-methylbut-2-enyl diphosphate reductase IspH